MIPESKLNTTSTVDSMQNQMVFIDKSAFIAFMDPSSPRHTKARSLFYDLDDLERPLATTELVIIETHDWLRDQIGFEQAQFFLNTIEKSIHKGLLTIYPVHKSIYNEAKIFLFEHPKFELSMGEAINLLILDLNQINRIFSFQPSYRDLPGTFKKLKVIPNLAI